MANPFKRSAAEHRPTLRPAPGMPAFELDSEAGFQPSDFDDDGDWEDSAQEFESGAVAPDPFAG